MRNMSHHLRLVGWYLLRVVLIVACLSMASWLAMRVSLYRMIDSNISQRMGGVVAFLKSQPNPSSIASMEIDGNYRIFDEHGVLIYQSKLMIRDGPAPIAPTVRPGHLVFRDFYGPSGGMRLGASILEFGGRKWIIELAYPLRFVQGPSRIFTYTLFFSAPLLIALGMLVSYAISRQALAPVDWIIQDVHAINPNNPEERLSIPVAHVQLIRLSETLNKMLDRVEDSIRRIRQFTADASHELRSPITLIRVAAEYCLSDRRTDEDQRKALCRILFEAERTTQILEDLLLLTRADTNIHSMEVTSIDFAMAAQEALKMIAPLADAKQIRVSTDIPNAKIWIGEGTDPIERLVFILLDNAVKYTPVGGEVRVVLNSVGQYANLYVADSGIGISAADLPHLFERFWRADKSHSRQNGGAGLGLAIAKSIIERSGGEIGVESELGKGSRFTVRIPLLDVISTDCSCDIDESSLANDHLDLKTPYS